MCRILLVEDNYELAENLAEVLESQGHCVTLAATAEQALEVLHTEAFDGILTDLRLPGKSGLDLLRAVRHAAYPLPVVLMTAFVSHGDRELAEFEGALAVLSKPLDLQRLLPLVAEFARAQRQVLVVDDNRALVADLADILRLEGFEPVIAHSLQEALAQRSLPYIALLDFKLPDGDGVQAALRLHARDPRLRVLLMTGHPEAAQEQLAKVTPSPSFATLAKPLALPGLVETLRDWARVAD